MDEGDIILRADICNIKPVDWKLGVDIDETQKEV